MKKISVWLACLLFTAGVQAQDNEVMYHVFQRSFFDSNGDGHGDVKGIHQKLDYLQQLGVTSILLTPLYQSDFYHNYFATDFEKTDEKYGGFTEYRDLVVEVHRRKMKIYREVDMQYISGSHQWFKDSFKKPSSEYSNYVYYDDKKNEKPYYFLNTPEFTTYDNKKAKAVAVNLKEPKVQEYMLKVLKLWADPNKDGMFHDGIDGLVFSDMADSLGNPAKQKDLFKTFWVPLITSLKKVNPKLEIIAEQPKGNSYGHDYFTKAGTDRVFANRLKQAIGTFDKEKIAAAADSTFNYNPAGKQQVVFIENHDTGRFASEKGMDAGRLKAAAALNVLFGGIPSLYYGQELGMKGTQQKGPTDGNDIPLREAFEWYAAEEGPGMALWYKDTGEWWDKRNMKPNDGISLEEQQKDPNSLYNYYKALLRLRKQHVPLHTGTYKLTPNANAGVFSFIRANGDDIVLVMVNLTGQEQIAMLTDNTLPVSSFRNFYGGGSFPRGGRALKLEPYGVQVFRYIPQGAGQAAPKK